MSRAENDARIRTTALVRAGWGVILLTLPGPLLRAGGGGPVPAAAVAVARVLGLRHLLQAGTTAAVPTGAVAGLGALADMAHASSCLALAAGSRRWRRVALADALIEAGFAAAGWRDRPQARVRPTYTLRAR